MRKDKVKRWLNLGNKRRDLLQRVLAYNRDKQGEVENTSSTNGRYRE